MGILLHQLNISIYNLDNKKFINVHETFPYEDQMHRIIALFNAKNIIKKTNWIVYDRAILVVCNSRFFEQELIYLDGVISTKYIKCFNDEKFLEEFTEELIAQD